MSSDSGSGRVSDLCRRSETEHSWEIRIWKTKYLLRAMCGSAAAWQDDEATAMASRRLRVPSPYLVPNYVSVWPRCINSAEIMPLLFGDSGSTTSRKNRLALSTTIETPGSPNRQTERGPPTRSTTNSNIEELHSSNTIWKKRNFRFGCSHYFVSCGLYKLALDAFLAMCWNWGLLHPLYR